jgi:hypothetical protein
MGEMCLETSLTEENASAPLHALAQYFALDKLELAIKEEQERREEEARKAHEEHLEKIFFETFRDLLTSPRCSPRCSTQQRRTPLRRCCLCVQCGDPTTVPSP